MKLKNGLWTSLVCVVAFLILILDAATAVKGAQEGIDLCIKSVIPSLFPLFILSNIINSEFTGKTLKFLNPIAKLCGIPTGSESLLLIGLLGGYPVGAKNINDAYKKGIIKSDDAKRMLGFCCNAGPAFIFGFTGMLFDTPFAVWCLWVIHILSAVLVGSVIPGRSTDRCAVTAGKPITLAESMNSSTKALVAVCGWVVLFRVVLAFCQRWFFILFPMWLQTVIAGLLELTNGCHCLIGVENQGLRFILCSTFLSAGGICVTMQTMQVTPHTGLGMYFPGKILQSLISLLFSLIVQRLIFPAYDHYNAPIFIWILLLIFLFALTGILRRKKMVAFCC